MVATHGDVQLARELYETLITLRFFFGEMLLEFEMKALAEEVAQAPDFLDGVCRAVRG